ncbi:MAG: hypothetical protein ACK54T_09775 [bacterium]
MSLLVKMPNPVIPLDLGQMVAHGSESLIDRPWCERVAQRLRGKFGNLIAAFPPHAQRATAMARLLGLQVPLCHRILSGTLASGGAALVLGTFPGTTGLTMFVHAVKSIQGAPQTLSRTPRPPSKSLPSSSPAPGAASADSSTPSTRPNRPTANTQAPPV